jgi:hypothetical protein
LWNDWIWVHVRVFLIEIVTFSQTAFFFTLPPSLFFSLPFLPSIHYSIKCILGIQGAWYWDRHHELRNIKTDTSLSSLSTHSVSLQRQIQQLLLYREKSDVHARYHVPLTRDSHEGSHEVSGFDLGNLSYEI